MIWEILKKDKRRYSRGRRVSTIALFLRNPGFRFVFLFRVCACTKRFSPIGVVARMWFKNVQRRYGFQIPHTTKIGGGLFFSHYGGIVVNPKTVIGENCNIAQGVTIGQINTGDKAGCPVIGNQVWIGPNAVVVGKITIDDDVLIAPLSYVNFDVPQGSVVMGNPAKIVGTKGSSGYVNSV
jgi:serine O-acetyltransferase